jgi:hypothetical protein
MKTYKLLGTGEIADGVVPESRPAYAIKLSR